jgi:hypothetical protein
MSVRTKEGIKGTPFVTPLWCDARKHALKRDNAKTPAFIMYRATRFGRYEGWLHGCAYCNDGVPIETDSPFAMELMVGIESRAPVDAVLAAQIDGLTLSGKDWLGIPLDSAPVEAPVNAYFCEAGKHCTQRDGINTPATLVFIWLQAGRYEGWEPGCAYCESDKPAEADSPLELERAAGIYSVEQERRTLAHLLEAAEFDGAQVIVKDYLGRKIS